MDAAPDVVVLDSTTDVSVDTVIDTSTVPDVREAAVEASLPPEAGASCGPYVDVLYRLAGTFRIANTPFGAGDTTQMVGTNGSLPMFATAGATTPFTVVPFSNGFVRLRFPNVGTGSTPVPGTGAIRLLEWYMPNEFSVGMGMTLSPRVDTNVDHSAGLLGLVMNNIPANPTLSRACASVADGTLAGTTLTWAACGVTPTGTTSFTVARAQAPAGMAAGCLRRMSVWGNIRCSAGGCGLVPAGSLGDQRATWDQPLRGFAFNGSNFATASFTMPEVQIPNDVSTTTWIAITSATPQRLECGTDASITCNEQCNATGCGP